MKRLLSRKQNRLRGFDYSQAEWYFITVCVKDKMNCLGNIENERIILNQYGKIVQEQWEWLPRQYNYMFEDISVVMPNHFHGILIINNDVGTGHDLSLRNQNVEIAKRTGRDLSLQKIKSLSNLVGAFKTRSSKLIHQAGNTPFAWQRSFYDRIIRTEQELYNIRQYIQTNPLKWELDIENSLYDLKKDTKEYYNTIF